MCSLYVMQKGRSERRWEEECPQGTKHMGGESGAETARCVFSVNLRHFFLLMQGL